MSYASSIFVRSTVERYVGYSISLLRGMVSDASLVVSQLQLMDDAERDRVLVEWNARRRWIIRTILACIIYSKRRCCEHPARQHWRTATVASVTQS